MRLGLNSVDEVKRAAEAILASVKAHAPQARIEGISIQTMARGTELILGAVSEPHFGPYVLVGLGGVLTVSLIVGFIVLMRWRESRHAAERRA